MIGPDRPEVTRHSPPSVGPNQALIACLILSGIVGILAVPYLFAAMFSVMIFDAPGSTEVLSNWVWFSVAAGYLPLLGFFTISAWVLMSKGDYRWSVRTAVTGSVLAVVPAALFFLAVIFD
jgi:hypothetical protein